MIDIESTTTGGGALLVGYLGVLVALYRTPERALAAATASPQATLYFLVLPLLGVLAGVHAYRDGPYTALGLFVFGSYLGIVGLGVTVRALLSPSPVGLSLGVGVLAIVLAVLATVTSLLDASSFLGWNALPVGLD